MLKNFLIKQMLNSKLKNLPEEQRSALIGVVEKNPQFFEKIVSEIQAGVKEGKDQNTVAMTVMMRHKQELQNLMQK